MTYLITFACYGCHLHGDSSGSVHRHHNLPGGRLLEADPNLLQAELRNMDQPPYRLSSGPREVVLIALRERCLQQQWKLLAAHVRTNHVHLVVEAEARPERIMNDLKSYASRCLNQKGMMNPLANGGHGMGARGGCGNQSMSQRPFATSWMSRENQWPYSRQSNPEQDRSFQSRLSLGRMCRTLSCATP